MIFLSSLLTSCAVDNDLGIPPFFLEVVPIESIEVPEEFIYGESHEISVTYTRPQACYFFNDFIYQIDGNERTISVVNTVYPDTDCTNISEEITVNFDFTPQNLDPFVFRFYQGEDENGIDQYLMLEIQVLQ